MAGDGAFFLSCRTAGRLLDVDRMTAWRWLFLLEQDGLIEKTATGTLAKRQAREFRFVMDRAEV